MFSSLPKRNIFEHFKREFSMTSRITAAKQNKELTKIAIETKSKIATLTLNRLSANALNLELITAIKDAVHELERQNVNGILITSASDRIFSAGLDFNEVYKPDIERLKTFWRSMQDMCKAIFATSIPTAALINGHALAGGCVIGLACDYRVILPKCTIGMNETRAGIAVPKWVMDSYVNVMHSRRVAEADLIAGNCYKSEGALKVGLVDAVIDTREEAFKNCFEFLSSFEGPTRSAKAQTKITFRADFLNEFENNKQKDLDSFVNNILRPEVQQFIGNYLKSLKEKSVKNTV